MTQFFTIGHSNHSIEEFLALLKMHNVAVVADVRSQPVSRMEHFNKSALQNTLKANGIKYVFMGRELGARRDEPDAYESNRADYGKIAQLPLFQEGIERLKKGAEDHLIALMCAEKEPLDCHRTVLVSRRLASLGYSVAHILADGTLEEHADTEERLIQMMKIERSGSLFDDQSAADRAYEARGLQIAYAEDEEKGQP